VVAVVWGGMQGAFTHHTFQSGRGIKIMFCFLYFRCVKENTEILEELVKLRHKVCISIEYILNLKCNHVFIKQPIEEFLICFFTDKFHDYTSLKDNVVNSQ
jgi:hypothetical protein